VTKIGYAVEGWRDKAFLAGLARRWCPGAELVPGRFRGSSDETFRRELSKTCREMLWNGARFLVILRDANREDWQEVKKRELAWLPAEANHCTVFGVTVENVEDWLNSDPPYLAERMGIPLEELQAEGDPKAALDRALGARSSSIAEERIAAMVHAAPVKRWIQTSRSFEAFYEDARKLAQRSGVCAITNERGA